jgi:L-asparaginase/Glu-tRNA(Gln) amidotransferase subunit D
MNVRTCCTKLLQCFSGLTHCALLCNVLLAGSQLPLASPRSDARQNLIDALTCATAAYTPPHMALNEVAVCFGGKLMRGNRAQKVNSSNYQVHT